MENFIVSARKYRPATFLSVVGQSHIAAMLKNAVNRGQLAHAYLFCGPRGVGKTTCARIFAKTINCLNLTSEGEACNECESCKGFNEGRSFNIHELDAASNNSVDDIRNLTDQVRIPPQVGRYSIYIIDEVHMLSLQAFNAFLKTLEEPPAHAVFILATTEKHKIIPTILSRCQIYDFNRIRVEDMVEYLRGIAEKEGVRSDEESLHIIAQKADGAMRDALSIFDKVVSFCGADLHIGQVAETLNVLDYDTYFTITEQILAGDYTAALMLFDEVLHKGFSGQTFVAGLNTHFRDLLMCKDPQTLSLLEVTGSVAERYKKQATQYPVPLLFEGIGLLTSVDASLRTATNQRLNVELGLMKLCGLGQKKNSDHLTPSLPPLTGGKSTAAPARPDAETPVPSGISPKVSAADIPPAATVSPEPATVSGKTGTDPVPASAPAEKIQPGEITGTSSPEKSAIPPVTPEKAKDTAPSKTYEPVSFSGRSIQSILNNRSAAVENENDFPEEEVEIGGAVEAALEKGCELFAREMMAERPRIGNIFQEVTVTGNRVRLQVPNASSRDELATLLTDVKKRLAELSGVKVPIEFDVTIAANTGGLKPIKAEDRLKFLTEKNPLLTKLRQELHLDVE